MIRFITAAIFLALYLVVSLPVQGIFWILRKKFPEKIDLISLRLVQWGFKVMLAISGVNATVIGEERIPEGPVLFIANHRSYFDILLTYSRCKNLTGYISKKEMEKFPVLSTWMKRLYCLFLDRENARAGLKTILTAIDYVKHGVSICIFPEGTRNTGEELSLLPFHEGSFKIATKTGCPIVPISMNNTASIFENHMPRIKKTHVVIEYGTPIYPNELDTEQKKQIGALVQNVIQDTINKNASLV